jgi:hypothetical protein
MWASGAEPAIRAQERRFGHLAHAAAGRPARTE